VIEKFNLSRVAAASIAGAVMWMLGFGSIYLAGFMDVIDGELTGAIALPLTGLLTILFVGWRMKKAMVNEQMHGVSPGLQKVMIILVRYVAPIFVGIVLLAGIHSTYFAGQSMSELMGSWGFRRLLILTVFIVLALVWSKNKNRKA